MSSQFDGAGVGCTTASFWARSSRWWAGLLLIVAGVLQRLRLGPPRLMAE